MGRIGHCSPIHPTLQPTIYRPFFLPWNVPIGCILPPILSLELDLGWSRDPDHRLGNWLYRKNRRVNVIHNGMAVCVYNKAWKWDSVLRSSRPPTMSTDSSSHEGKFQPPFQTEARVLRLVCPHEGCELWPMWCGSLIFATKEPEGIWTLDLPGFKHLEPWFSNWPRNLSKTLPWTPLVIYWTRYVA